MLLADLALYFLGVAFSSLGEIGVQVVGVRTVVLTPLGVSTLVSMVASKVRVNILEVGNLVMGTVPVVGMVSYYIWVV